jgi:hypothetical protein
VTIPVSVSGSSSKTTSTPDTNTQIRTKRSVNKPNASVLIAYKLVNEPNHNQTKTLTLSVSSERETVLSAQINGRCEQAVLLSHLATARMLRKIMPARSSCFAELARSTYVLCFLQVALAGVWLYLVPFPRPLFFFPSEVRPRASRCLCTGFAIQLILASRRIALWWGLVVSTDRERVPRSGMSE